MTDTILVGEDEVTCVRIFRHRDSFGVPHPSGEHRYTFYTSTIDEAFQIARTIWQPERIVILYREDTGSN